MTSGDSNLEKSAFEKADKFLGNDTKKTHKSSVGGFDRSVVNKYEDDKKKNTNKVLAFHNYTLELTIVYEMNDALNDKKHNHLAINAGVSIHNQFLIAEVVSA